MLLNVGLAVDKYGLACEISQSRLCKLSVLAGLLAELERLYVAIEHTIHCNNQNIVPIFAHWLSSINVKCCSTKGSCKLPVLAGLLGELKL